MANVAGNPYIGAHITLLSKAEIRYEGTLFSIDMEGATITLQTGAHLQHYLVMREREKHSSVVRPKRKRPFQLLSSQHEYSFVSSSWQNILHRLFGPDRLLLSCFMVQSFLVASLLYTLSLILS